MAKWNNSWNGLCSVPAVVLIVKMWAVISPFNSRPPLSNNNNNNNNDIFLHKYPFNINFKKVSQTTELRVHFLTSAETTVTSERRS